MTTWYAFNGDADGLCALQQLRLADGQAATLVTGDKRDIELLRRVSAATGDRVTVLDVSFDVNRNALQPLLDAGVSVRWFDHHHAGALPVHRGFEPHIDTATDVCTSLLVDRALGGRHRLWAITAAYGDGLKDVADRLCRSEGLPTEQAATLEQLGTLLNYNAYGDALADLHFDPALLAGQMLPFTDPFEFVRGSPTFARLAGGYEADMARARELPAMCSSPSATVVVLPDEAWARRAIGSLANELMRERPDSGIAILSPKPAGGYTVSVRAPADGRSAADALCRQFPTGGGRRGAGGINDLPGSDVESFVARFEEHFACG